MMRRMTLLALSFTATTVAAEPVLLGVLEERVQCVGAENKPKPSVRARIMFAKGEDRWEGLNFPMGEFPEVTPQDWTVALDGRSLGTLKLDDPTPGQRGGGGFYYERDKVYVPVGKVPSVVNSRKSFGGWCGVPGARPLIMLSKPNVRDPAGWKRFAPGPEYARRLQSPLRLVLGRTNVVRCPDGANVEAFEFRTEHLKIYAGYRSDTDGILVSIGLKNDLYNCDGPGGTTWASQWFLIRGNEVHHVGSAMELVDAADYDGDGKSELLFWQSAYNRDGYILIFDDLRQRIEYTWRYH
jgi:hypothetical protein